MTPARFQIFRWRAVGPLLLFLLFGVILWVLFADTIARVQTQSNLSDLLGTEVDIGSLRIRETDAAVDIGGLAIADPRDPRKNLLEAGDITLDLDPVPLTEKKIVIDQLRLSGLRFLTTRKTPARPADPDSPAGKLLQETQAWARDKFNFPRLVMGRIDSAKSLILKPEQLGTVKAVQALGATADSGKAALEQSLAALQLQPLVDSSAALASRLARTDVKKLGVAGVKDAAGAVQQHLDQIKRKKSELQGLEQAVHAFGATLTQGLAQVDQARQQDYALARGLLDLPSFDAPNIGASLFGAQSTDYFQQALYYARIAQRYVPPGLQPWNRPGPVRTRLAGETVEFPKEKEYPRFLLRQGDIDLATGSSDQNTFRAAFAGITSQPALYGKPATLTASGRLSGDTPLSVDLAAMSRHFGNSPKDSLRARVTGVTLPAIQLPGLPFAVHPGQGNVGFAFSLAGEQLAGSWEISSDQARWTGDSATLGSASLVESTLWRVVSGLTQLRVRAELGGTVEHPTLAVSSNLDDAIAARLKGLVGEELAKAELKARAAVDQLVAEQVSAMQARVEGVSSAALARLPVEKGRLDGVEQQLQAQLKRLGAGALGGITLPKL